MTKVLIILLIALVFEAVGVVLLSGGLKEIGEPAAINVSEIGRLVKRGVTNRNILIGTLLETIFFGALLYLLSQRDVSLIWPLTSLGFLITAVAAKIFLHEQISGMRWLGVCLIVIGAGVISWSEQTKKNEESKPAVSSTVTPNSAR